MLLLYIHPHSNHKACSLHCMLLLFFQFSWNYRKNIFGLRYVYLPSETRRESVYSNTPSLILNNVGSNFKRATRTSLDLPRTSDLSGARPFSTHLITLLQTSSLACSSANSLSCHWTCWTSFIPYRNLITGSSTS